MSIIYGLLIGVAVYIGMKFFLSSIQKYLDNREEDKLISRVENRINGMGQEERLSILNSDDFKKWQMEQWDAGMPDEDMESFKLLEGYILDNLKKFF